MNGDEINKIDNLNNSLYSRNTPDIRSRRRIRTHEQETSVGSDWDHPKEIVIPESEQGGLYKDTSMSFFTKILVTSIIFFILALGIGAFLVFNGSNFISGDNVDINITSPASVAGGEPLIFDVQIANRNNIKLEQIHMKVDFPSGTTYVEDSLRELRTSQEQVDDITPGGVGQKTFKAVIYGEENTTKDIKVSIEYQVKGSNAIFQKEKIFNLLISSSPLSLTISSFKEINSGQEFELTAVMASNSKEVIKNLLLKAVYPFGFTYISSDVKPYADTTVWKIGDIPPGAKKTIKIKGKLEGQDDEMRSFRFITGAYKLGNDSVIGTQYITSTQEISLRRPFLSADIDFNGDTSNDQFITSFNNSVKVDISYFNNLSTSITDAEIHVKVAGSAFDRVSITPDEGLYDSSLGEIVWNGRTTEGLQQIEGSGNGKVSFNIVPRNISSIQKQVINPDLLFTVNIKGKRVSETNVPENIVSTASRIMKISSGVSLIGQVLRSSGPFVNTGIIPPQVEKDTTYTVVWTVGNTTNNISNTIITASLPAYVKWLGKVNPSTEDISYDNSSGKIIWNAGGVSAYTTGSSHRKSVSFQVSLRPTINQIDTVPILINQASLKANDDFTGEDLESNLGVLTTRFSTDQVFKDGDEKVVR
jgi:hypothetical protein